MAPASPWSATFRFMASPARSGSPRPSRQGNDPWGNARVAFLATTTIDRRDFGLGWNAALESGGVLVSNEIKLTLDVQAIGA